MIAISIQKPDIGNIVAVRPNVPLVKGLAPVMNIVLSYSTFVPISVLTVADTNLAQLAQFGKLGCYLHRRVADNVDLGRSSAKL
jgi:hypothetical protein